MHIVYIVLYVYINEYRVYYKHIYNTTTQYIYVRYDLIANYFWVRYSSNGTKLICHIYMYVCIYISYMLNSISIII